MSIHFSPRTGIDVGGMAVGNGVQLGEGLGAGVGVGVFVLVGVGVCVAVGVGVLVGVGVEVAVPVAVGVGVKVGVDVAVGVLVGGKKNARSSLELSVMAMTPAARQSSIAVSIRPDSRGRVDSAFLPGCT